MFPLRERGRANGLTTFTNWFFSAVVGAVFPIASTASLSGCFVFFAVAIFLGTMMVHFFLPETANLTNFEIDEAFKAKGEGGGMKRIPSSGGMKRIPSSGGMARVGSTEALKDMDDVGVEQAKGDVEA